MQNGFWLSAILVLSSTLLPQTTFAYEDVDLLCEQTSQAHLVGKSPSTSDNPCEATAKIQALAYECGSASDTYTFTTNALAKNIEKAETMCLDYCKKQSKTCTGYLDKPFNCGLSTPTNRALDVGENKIGCPKHCKGRAFNYCSLYHGNFFGTDSSLFTAAKPNCHCRKK